MGRRRTWLEWLNPMTRVYRWFTFGSILWLMSCTTLLLLAFVRKGIPLSALFAIYMLLTVICSLFAFVLYGIDQRRAVKQRPRINERMLHLRAGAGGWPGAYLGWRLFGHKTRNLSFQAVYWLSVLAHLVIIGYCLVFGSWWETAKALLKSQSVSAGGL